MNIINFSHPITDAQLKQIHAVTGQEITVYTVPVHIDFNGLPIVDQIDAILATIPEEAFNDVVVVNLPGMSLAAALIVIRLYHKLGVFPAILALKRADGIPVRFELWDIVDL
ncbi:MAG: hypothetical protein D6823_07990 [Chloroflexi bacterium]|jgi:hypothetical protein|nr:MAG: hypothetical protein D6823_07990 [Chloroflexota bacterium]